jgi:hypothetical protein
VPGVSGSGIHAPSAFGTKIRQTGILGSDYQGPFNSTLAESFLRYAADRGRATWQTHKEVAWAALIEA